MFKPKKAKESQADFESIALVHIDSLYSYALRMTRNTSEAEDLVQESYLKAYRFWDKFQPGTNCKAWLLKIMTNIFINKYREKMKEPQILNFDEIEQDFLYTKLVSSGFFENKSTPLQEILRKTFEDDVKRALDKLPAEFKMVAVLAFIEDFSYEEISEILGIQMGTVKSRLHRGRKLLQKALWEYAQKRGFGKGA